MSKRAGLFLGIMLLLSMILHLSAEPFTVSAQATSETLRLTAYLDGFVLIDHQLTLNQTYPSINVGLIGQLHEDILVIDEQNLPLEFVKTNNELIIYSLNATRIKITYFTQDLTSKTGKYWTLTAETPTNATLILPEDITIISVNTVPELIQSAESQIILVMPSGTIEITYVAEHELRLENQKPNEIVFIIAAFALLITVLIMASAIWFARRKKPSFAPVEPKKEVDTKKLFGKHKDLRHEEIQVISFLTDKHGTAFEAELYEKLDLPRTTTWRLLKRMQSMGIVDIIKSRRQNIVSIKKKYLKK